MKGDALYLAEANITLNTFWQHLLPKHSANNRQQYAWPFGYAVEEKQDAALFFLPSRSSTQYQWVWGEMAAAGNTIGAELKKLEYLPY